MYFLVLNTPSARIDVMWCGCRNHEYRKHRYTGVFFRVTGNVVFVWILGLNLGLSSCFTGYLLQEGWEEVSQKIVKPNISLRTISQSQDAWQFKTISFYGWQHWCCRWTEKRNSSPSRHTVSHFCPHNHKTRPRDRYITYRRFLCAAKHLKYIKIAACHSFYFLILLHPAPANKPELYEVRVTLEISRSNDWRYIICNLIYLFFCRKWSSTKMPGNVKSK